MIELKELLQQPERLLSYTCPIQGQDVDGNDVYCNITYQITVADAIKRQRYIYRCVPRLATNEELLLHDFIVNNFADIQEQ